jgi:hypothetical protein
LPLRAIDGFTGVERFDGDSATRKDNMMSQDPKPDFLLKCWFVAISATGIPGMIAGLTGLAMVLTFIAVIKGMG